MGKKNHKDEYKECKKKKHDDCCCDYPEVERQVNNPADDVDNFPRITQSETSLARFNDFILYGFNDSNDNIGGPGNASFSGFAFSNDLGNTWTDGGSIPVNPGALNGGDPSIAVDSNGVFYYGQIGSEEVVEGIPEGVISVSTGIVNPNGTITMNDPQVVGRGQNLGDNNPNVFFEQDKEWITVGPDANTPVNQPLNEALYVAWTDFNLPNPGTRIRFSKFNTGVMITPIIESTTIVSGNNEVFGAFPVVDSRGIIYVFYESRLPGSFPQLGVPNRSIRMVKSTDGGNNFEPPVEVSNGLFAAAATNSVLCGTSNRPVIEVSAGRVIRMFEIPQASIGPDGTIYVVWNAGTVVGNRTYIDIFLAYSQDEGNSWNHVRITNNLSHSFFPSVAVNCTGAHIQYNHFNDPNEIGGVGDGTFGVFMKSFSPFTGLSEERMVSTQFSQVPVTNPNPGGDVAPCYMAEYNQVITGPGNCLLHSWSDNRNILNGRLNPDVFFRLTSDYDCESSSNDCESSSNDCESSSNDCESSSNDCESSSNDCESSSNDCESSSN
ncbi:sialidase family protein, partial [Peribacillus frigoritolerans]